MDWLRLTERDEQRWRENKRERLDVWYMCGKPKDMLRRRRKGHDVT
jgi:hypothetical protein